MKVIAKAAGGAIHVLDRFHVMQKLTQAIDEVRGAKAKPPKADVYESVPKGPRLCL